MVSDSFKVGYCLQHTAYLSVVLFGKLVFIQTDKKNVNLMIEEADCVFGGDYFIAFRVVKGKEAVN